MGRLLEVLRTRLRGILGLGAVTGTIGYLAGAVWGLLNVANWPLLLRTPDAWRIIVENLEWLIVTPLLYGFTWAIPAGLIGAVFGGVLALGDGRRSLDDLPMWRMGASGALIGAAIPVLSTVQIGGVGLLASTFGHLIGEIGLLAAVGGVLSSGLVAVAQRAHRRDLAVVDEVAALAAPDTA